MNQQPSIGGASMAGGAGGNMAVSPELAAQIVKNYILPMFESDQRK